MKDWRLWVFLIGIYLMIKMCGGCLGCGNGISKGDLMDAIEDRYGMDVRHINSIEKVQRNPETYRFVFEWNMGGIRERQSGYVYLFKDGAIDRISLINDATVVGSD